MGSSRSKKQISRPMCFAILAALGVVLVAGGVLVYNSASSDRSNKTPAAQNGNVNYRPATETEKQDSDRLKEVDAQREGNPQTNTVTPVIVDASQYGDSIEVRSYVPGVIEDSGTCTIKFTKGQLTLTKQTSAAQDATNTRCGNLNIARNEFEQPGRWTVTVSYTSASSSGGSQPRTLEVK